MMDLVKFEVKQNFLCLRMNFFILISKNIFFFETKETTISNKYFKL